MVLVSTTEWLTRLPPSAKEDYAGRTLHGTNTRIPIPDTFSALLGFMLEEHSSQLNCHQWQEDTAWQWGPTSTWRKLPFAFLLPFALSSVLSILYFKECQPSFLWSNVPWYWGIRTSGFLRIFGGYFILNDTSSWECRDGSNWSFSNFPHAQLVHAHNACPHFFPSLWHPWYPFWLTQ